MNINSMIMKIRNFNEYIIESGFLRDVKEFIKTIRQPQNSENLVLLRDITEKVIEQLEVIQESDLSDDLNKLLPGKDVEPLRPEDHIDILRELISDTQVNTSEYYTRLLKALTDLQSEIEANSEEIETLYNVLLPYYDKELEISEKAVMSLIFKDIETISTLKNFTNVLHKWNRSLHIYHQLVSSKTPEDVELVNVQSGSLDVILNIDLNVALNLTEIVKYGFLAFNGYLLYKMRAGEIVATYFGNKKLLKAEKERENDLLENIGSTIKRQLSAQHKSLKKKDKDISVESITKKIDDVAKVLSEHIVKGNDIKLLVDIPGDDEATSESRKLMEETRKASLDARNHLKKLGSGDAKLLIDKYSIEEKDEE